MPDDATRPGPLDFAICAACSAAGHEPRGTVLCASCTHNRRALNAFHLATDPRLNGARRRALQEAGR